MRIINVVPEMDQLQLGKQGENKSTKFLFDVSDWLEKYPGCTITLVNRRPNENSSYPCVLTTEEDGRRGWVINSADLAIDGKGECELKCTLDDMIEKDKRTWKTKIKKSLSGDGDAPEPWESLMDDIEGLVGDAQDAAEDAEAAKEAAEEAAEVAVHAPIIQNGYWYTWDATTEQYVNSGAKAQGEEGDPGQDATPALITTLYADLIFPVAAGTMCSHNGLLYKANQEIATSEAWTAAHWTQTTIEAEQSAIIAEITNKINFVTPEDFGAKGDGTTDDTTAIQNALNSGRDVYFPRKTYLTTGVQISSQIHVYFDDTTFDAKTYYQDHVISITNTIHIEGRVTINGKYKALCGIKFNNSYGSLINVLNVKNCMVWGVWIDYSDHAQFDYIRIQECGTTMDLTVSYESNTLAHIDSELSEKNNTLLSSDYAVNMYMYDNSEYPRNDNGGLLFRLMVSYDTEEKAFVCGDTTANRLPSNYLEKACKLCFGGGVFVGKSCNSQINFGIIDSRLSPTSITFSSTYGHNINSFYSQSDKIPIAVTSYCLGNTFGSFTAEGSQSGYIMVSYYYDYSVIVTRSTGYDTNFDAKQIVSLTGMGKATQNPILLKSLRRTLPQYYGLGDDYVLNEQNTDNLVFSNKNSLILDLKDTTPKGSYDRNPWGVKTVYFLPSSSQNNNITISLTNELVTDGYTIDGGTNGAITFERPSDIAWFKVQITLINKKFTILIDELSKVGPIITGSNPVINGEANHRYVCGEVSTLSITAPSKGIIDIVFESGSTPAVLTVSSSIKWANGFDPSNLEANTTYELNILDGELGVACSWT